MKISALFLSVVIASYLTLIPVSASSKHDNDSHSLVFEEWSPYGLESQITESINNSNECLSLNLHFENEDVDNCIYYIKSSADICDYESGRFSDFTKQYPRSVLLHICKDNYTLTGGLVLDDPSTFRVNNILETKPVFQEHYNNIINTFEPYGDSGNVYFMLYIGQVYAVITDKNDHPLYVVFDSNHFDLFDELAQYTEQYNQKEWSDIANAFDNLYQLGNGQLVFDFDFVKDAFSAAAGRLPDDYVFEPHGLESELKNKIKAIDGTYYYFNNQGICTGRYTGWTKSSKGKRYYLKGKYLTGDHIINNKNYSFDKSGYLI